MHGVYVPVDQKIPSYSYEVSIDSVIKFLHVLHVPSIAVCMVL